MRDVSFETDLAVLLRIRPGGGRADEVEG